MFLLTYSEQEGLGLSVWDKVKVVLKLKLFFTLMHCLH